MSAAAMDASRSELAATPISDLQDEIGRVLGDVIPAGSPVAVLDFPTHGNIGDYAIWLGQLAYLRRAGHKVVYICAQRDYSSERLTEHLGDGIILFVGGGNLGDLWPSHQDLREQVMADFPDRKIVQLPQSIHFQDDRRLAAAQRAFDAHPDFTLVVRDTSSLAFARDAFNCDSRLSPDLAFGLGRLRRAVVPSREILCLARTDPEGKFGDDLREIGLEAVDWPMVRSRRYATARRLTLATRRRAKGHARAFDLVSPITQRACEALARHQLGLGQQILGQGAVTITDRLHGHILCVLMGIPHVVLDNSYGKVRNYYETWTKRSPLVRWADRPAEARPLALSLLAEPAIAADRPA